MRKTASTTVGGPLSPAELQAIDAWWRAANYLSVGQIYLMGNPLLREPLRPEHVKPRLLGHWGTTPGLNFVYAHLNRAIAARDLDLIYVMGPGSRRARAGGGGLARGHLQRGLPGRLAGRRRHGPAVHPVLLPRRHPQPRRAGDARLDPRGRRARLRARRTPTARPSTTRTSSSPPSSGTARPRPGRWRPAGTRTSSSTRATDGAVLPILHLNGYKIANPTVLARIPREELMDLLRGYGHDAATSSRAPTPTTMHQAFAATLDRCLDEIAAIQRPGPRGRRHRAAAVADDRAAPRPRAGPARPRSTASGSRASWRSHQVPFAERPRGRRAPAGPRGVAAQLPARGALRRRRRPGGRRPRPAPGRRRGG